MSIRLAPPIEAQIEELVATGEFTDANAVMAGALELLQARQARLHQLRADLEVARQQEERGELIELTEERIEAIKRRGRSELSADASSRAAVQS